MRLVVAFLRIFRKWFRKKIEFGNLLQNPNKLILPRIVEISGGIDVCGKPLKTRFRTVFSFFNGLQKLITNLVIGQKNASGNRPSCYNFINFHSLDCKPFRLQEKRHRRSILPAGDPGVYQSQFVVQFQQKFCIVVSQLGYKLSDFMMRTIMDSCVLILKRRRLLLIFVAAWFDVISSSKITRYAVIVLRRKGTLALR